MGTENVDSFRIEKESPTTYNLIDETGDVVVEMRRVIGEGIDDTDETVITYSSWESRDEVDLDVGEIVAGTDGYAFRELTDEYAKRQVLGNEDRESDDRLFRRYFDVWVGDFDSRVVVEYEEMFDGRVTVNEHFNGLFSAVFRRRYIDKLYVEVIDSKCPIKTEKQGMSMDDWAYELIFE